MNNEIETLVENNESRVLEIVQTHIVIGIPFFKVTDSQCLKSIEDEILNLCDKYGLFYSNQSYFMSFSYSDLCEDNEEDVLRGYELMQIEYDDAIRCMFKVRK